MALIGITGRRLASAALQGMDTRFEDRLVDVHFSDYAVCLDAAGASGVHLPLSGNAVELVSRLDGVILTGGQDVHSVSRGRELSADHTRRDPRLDRTAPDLERDKFEIALFRAAVTAGCPVLAVCRGMQLVNVALGGTLVDHLGQCEPASHNQPSAAPDDGPDWHDVKFEAGSRMFALYGPSRVTNSWHHQAIDGAGSGLRVTGRTSDGVVEAAEMASQPVMTVQWHPEWAVRPDPVFGWLVDASRERAERAGAQLSN